MTTGTGQVASTASSAKATTAMVTQVVALTASRHLCAGMQLLTKENSVIMVIKLAVPQVALLTLCFLEQGYTCSGDLGQSSKCQKTIVQTVCGNGVVETGE